MEYIKIKTQSINKYYNATLCSNTNVTPFQSSKGTLEHE